jgi:Mrp family chromosome partitioning ATPase
LLLGKTADGVLLVVRPGVVNSTALTNVKTVLEQSSEQILGIVMNGTAHKSNYGGYYAYGSPYRASQAAELASLESLLPKMRTAPKRNNNLK